MTTQELQEHLNKLVYDIEGLRLVIDADQRYIDHLLSQEFEIDVRPYVRHAQSYMEKDRRTMSRHLATIEAWSQLITKDTNRQIYIDHYMNGLTWHDIEEKYHYSTSMVFHINKTCCDQIAQNLVCEIVPDCNTKTDTAVSL